MSSEFEEAYDAWLDGQDEYITSSLIEQCLGDWEMATPVMVSGDTTLRRTIGIMKDRHVGCVIVGDAPNGVVGIFSERDLLLRVVGQGIDFDTATVALFMTSAPQTLQHDDSIAQALQLMITEGFRHVPVLDADDHLIGVFSMRDAARFVAELFPKEVHNAPPAGHPTGPPRRYGG
jgi:CBS domain-containing protein